MWIARDKNGELYAYTTKPIRYGEYFGASTDWSILDEELWLDKESYPEVTWENSPKELVVKMD